MKLFSNASSTMSQSKRRGDREETKNSSHDVTIAFAERNEVSVAKEFSFGLRGGENEDDQLEDINKLELFANLVIQQVEFRIRRPMKDRDLRLSC